MNAAWLGTIRRVAPIVLLLANVNAVAARSTDWLPVPPEDLTQTGEPLAPAAPAIYLYRQIDRDDSASSELVYERIKVLKDQGRSYGDVQLPYRRWERIDQIQARVVQPDGTTTDFAGEIFDKPMVSGRDAGTSIKSFSLPDVRVGSIIEYRYRHKLRSGYVYDSQWLLNADLFTRFAKYSLKPYRDFTLRWSWPAGLPPGTVGPRREKRMVFLETHNVPAFVTEESMPPAETMKYRVNFIYDSNTQFTDAEQWWNDYASNTDRWIRNFVQDQSAIKQALEQILTPGDTPEQKARKIYAQVQQIRNLTYRLSVSEAESDRERLNQRYKAGDVLNRGYGNEIEISWLCYGMLKTAGLDVSYIVPASREHGFFSSRLMDPRAMDGGLILLQIEGRSIFLDPGIPLLPFGVQPWYKTQIQGLKVAREGGTWISVPLPPPTEGTIHSKGQLRLDSSGTLEGRLTLTWRGHEAWARRFDRRDRDEEAKIQYLVDDQLDDLPPRTELKLVNSPDWKGVEEPLVAEFDLKVVGWATAAGRSMVLPVGLYGAMHKDTFKRPDRVHPIYFRGSYEKLDDIHIQLPPGWRVANMPKPRSSDLKMLSYSVEARSEADAVRLQRNLMINFVLAPADQYSKLRGFFETVRAGDTDPVVLSQVSQ